MVKDNELVSNNRKGSSRISVVIVALVTFALSFLTESIVASAFQTMSLFQPILLSTPILVSFVSFIVQDRYQKITERFVAIFAQTNENKQDKNVEQIR